MNDLCFQHRTAVVTGAGGTLGAAIAVELARRGAKVALLGRTLEKLERVAETIRAHGGTALPLAVDVMHAAELESARETITAQLGLCTMLVNAAGGNRADATTTVNEFTPAELAAAVPEGCRGFFQLQPQAMLDVIALNTLGTIVPCQVFGRGMAAAGRGAILNFASMNSARPLSRNLAYGAAKAGVVNLTQWLASYLAPAGIRVNAIAPGFFLNERSRKILMTEAGGLTARGQNVLAHTPMKRFGEPADLLDAACWLLSEDPARFVTGITLPIDGGFLASSGV